MPKYTERFEMFWKLHPRRNGKLLGKVKCFQYWKKLKEEDELLVCRAAGAYSQYYKRALRPGEFRPEPRDPERFLRLDWWRDWLEPDTAQCGFRSLSQPCSEVALPGETHCQKHKDQIAALKRQRERSATV